MNGISYKGKEFKIYDRMLSISHQGIKEIDEIKGLTELKNLKILALEENEISKIKGLEIYVLFLLKLFYLLCV